jgi:hypothetical protein
LIFLLRFINGECTGSIDVSIDSPQGNVLSPIFIACFINDVGDHIRHCRFHLYAVDVNQLVALINVDLQRILNWSPDNSLIPDASKTQALCILESIRSEDVSSDLIWGWDSVQLSDVLKSLEV